MMKRIALLVLVPMVIIIIGSFLTFTAEGETMSPGEEGKIHSMYSDLVVVKGTVEVMENETLIMNGDIRVEGKLVLRNISVFMNSTYNGEYGIQVLPSGKLEILENCRIENMGEMHYTFQVTRNTKDHGVLSIRDSAILGVGYYSTRPENTGLYLESKKVSIIRTSFSDNFIGVRFNDVHGEVRVHDCTFKDNQQGIVIDDSSGFILQGNIFRDNGKSIHISRSEVIDITDNAFYDNDHAIEIDNTTEYYVGDNVFIGNLFTGLNIEFSYEGTLEDNQITKTCSQGETVMGTGILLRANSQTTITDNSLTQNDIGIMIIHNNSGLSLKGNVIRGGILGMYLYDEHVPNDYSEIVITETDEAAFNMRHCSDQTFSDVTIVDNLKFSLNITSSTVRFTYPKIDELDYVIDKKSSVILSSGIRVRAIERNGFTLSGSEVLVTNEGKEIYATRGYGGNDPVMDDIGMTDWIPLDYTILKHGKINLCRIEVFVNWEGYELIRTTFGEVKEIEQFYFSIPDLTLSGKDVIIAQSEIYDNEISLISSTLTNLGTADITTDVCVYRISGIWNGETHLPVHEFSVPFHAELIERTSVSVNGKEKKTVDVGWLPGSAGDYTIITIIDEDENTQELRKNNNIAIIHLNVQQGEAIVEDRAMISLEIPQSLHNSNVSDASFDLIMTLKNHGQKLGTVLIMGTISQHDETILFFNEVSSVPAGKEIKLQIPVELELGDAVLNFTLLQRIGEDSLEILTPYVSFILHVREGPGFAVQGDDEPIIPGVILYSATAGVIAFGFAIVVFAESARYRFLLLFVPLYMRMSKKDIVEHYTRGEILGYIKQNPGESYNNIKRDMEMSNGKLAYHLSVLEKGGFLKSVTDGMYRRYYPRKMKVTTYGRITSVQEEILRRIEETPGITQKDLSKIVNLSTATVNYHIRKLTSKGLIVSKRTGIFIHYYLDDHSVEEIMSNAISSARKTTVKR